MSEFPAELTVTTQPPHKLIEITFGGLCSFVEWEDTQRVLLLAAERSSVRPGLCPHTSILLFRGKDLAGIDEGPFYRSFLDAEGDVLCAWNLDGCDVEIRPDGYARPDNLYGMPPIEADSSFGYTLDLRPHGNVVAKGWLEGPLHPGDLVSARFNLLYGRLSCNQTTKKKWAMVRRGSSPPSSGQRLGQAVTYELRAQKKARRVELTAKNYRDGGRLTLRLKPKARVSVSSLCALTKEQVFEERDVLAYYDLCQDPPPQAQRHRPVLLQPTEEGVLRPDPVVPGQSACPPARQSGPVRET